MNKQQKTITRLLEIKRRASEAAETAHALAHNEAAKAEHERVRADTAWLTALDRTETIGTVSDLEERDAHVRTLRRKVDAAERLFYLARMKETHARELMTDARVELRRFEMWLERTQAEQAAEARRVERIAEDEVASRKRSAG